ncbi:hypothetical protein SKAU_G00040010 [Synaphobranchus kaupii]|uniref:Uncharacterized protein n=1 Tax=Synaphobranchus kaupii TaxID=118154 RepID=A0A9Q1GH87_SYNKA|nr:hypothetical protein SKAU_G00040010 [Synaphobranchus kaupii]
MYQSHLQPANHNPHLSHHRGLKFNTLSIFCQLKLHKDKVLRSFPETLVSDYSGPEENRPLKKQAEKHKQKPEYKTLEPEPELNSAPASEAPSPAHYTPSSPKVYSSIRTLRDSLAVLEQEFTQFREDTLANCSSHTQQANSESTPPHVDTHTSTLSLNTPKTSKPTGQHNEADVIILCDSNGKYLNESRLFPGRKVIKLRCPTTQTALELLSEQRLGHAKHVLIHTGTNDLSTRRIDVAKALKQVAAKATQEYPAAKVTISTLLPRTDVPQRIIHSINAEVSLGCALLPNVHLAHHRDIRHYHLYDQVHLNKEGVKMFTRVLKDTALGRTSTSNYSDKRNPAIHRRPAPPHTALSPRPPMQRNTGSVLNLQQRPAQPHSPLPARPCSATLAAC